MGDLLFMPVKKRVVTEEKNHITDIHINLSDKYTFTDIQERTDDATGRTSLFIFTDQTEKAIKALADHIRE